MAAGSPELRARFEWLRRAASGGASNATVAVALADAVLELLDVLDDHRGRLDDVTSRADRLERGR